MELKKLLLLTIIIILYVYTIASPLHYCAFIKVPYTIVHVILSYMYVFIGEQTLPPVGAILILH